MTELITNQSELGGHLAFNEEQSGIHDWATAPEEVFAKTLENMKLCDIEELMANALEVAKEHEDRASKARDLAAKVSAHLVTSSTYGDRVEGEAKATVTDIVQAIDYSQVSEPVPTHAKGSFWGDLGRSFSLRG